METKPLEMELQVYDATLAQWIDEGHQGKFVLIKDKEVKGIFGTYEEALKTGYLTCKQPPFLVKQISAVQQIMFITRRLIPNATSNVSPH